MSTIDTPGRPGSETPTGPIPVVPAGSPDTTATNPALTQVTDTARHRLRPDGGGPGATRFEQAAVEKLASHAASEVDQVGGAANRVLGLAVGSDSAERSPKVSAQIDGAITTVAVRLSVTYPAPVGQVTARVREHLAERLSTLAGLDARRIDITVAALHTPTAPQRRLA